MVRPTKMDNRTTMALMTVPSKEKTMKYHLFLLETSAIWRKTEKLLWSAVKTLQKILNVRSWKPLPKREQMLWSPLRLWFSKSREQELNLELVVKRVVMEENRRREERSKSEEDLASFCNYCCSW